MFLVSGFWHGAKWTFIVWGALHGAYIVVETLIIKVIGKREPNAVQLWLQRGLTFGLVVFAWIFFRANSLGDAMYVIQNLLDFSDG